jgi:GT2 family glycosyltransferase
MSARVTAIVLNWCKESDTASCLESLAGSRHDALDVLLVDNGSSDGSGERLHARFPNVAYLQTGTNLGYAGGNNRGIQRALEGNTEYLLVLNNDTVVDAACVANLVRASEETGAPVVAPLISYFDEPDRVWYGGGAFSRMRALGRHLLENELIDPVQTRAATTFVCGCCFLMRADVARRIGGFDESFFAYVEDVELSVRLAKAGVAMLYEPSARVLHRVTRHDAGSPFQIRQRDRNRRRLVRLHYDLAARVGFGCWFYPTRFAHLLRYSARRDWPRARAIVEGALGRLDAG